jgi:putative RNA 2'-phosphotransferase
MLSEERMVKLSKYLSKHLRHAPERIGLRLASGGWVGVDELLAACARNRMPISREELALVVADNSKQRFSFDETGQRIRANQGHSVSVDLGLAPKTPPALLYHGTGHRTIDAIKTSGLLKMSRHHVHLSSDLETARRVGMRHGRPSIFVLDTARMVADGFVFFCSDNGVWLVDRVPPQYLSLLS